MDLYGSWLRLKDPVGHTTSRITTHRLGTLSHRKSLRIVRAQAKTLIADDLLATRKIRKDIKIIHRNARKLRVLVEKRMPKLLKKAEGHPEAKEKLVHRFLLQQVKLANDFADAYEDFISTITTELVHIVKKREGEDYGVAQIIERSLNAARNSSVFTEEDTVKARKEIKKLLARKELSIKKDRKQAIRDYRKKGRWWHIVGGGYFAHHMKRSWKKAARFLSGDAYQILQEIERQQKTGLRVNHFDLITTYLKANDSATDIFEKILHDARLLIAQVDDEFMTAKKAIAQIIARVGNEDQAVSRALVSKLTTLTHKQQNIEQVVKMQAKADHQEEITLGSMLESIDRLFDRLQDQSHKLLESIEENPDEYLRTAQH